MAVFADLHLHTNASDGSDSPERVVERALEVGVRVIAVTDHDTVSGVRRAMERAAGTETRVFSGIELTTDFAGRELHLLGYGVAIANEALRAHCRVVETKRRARFEAMLEKLARLGVAVESDAILSRVEGSVPSRLHLAQALVEAGHVAHLEEAFTQYLRDNGPACVSLNACATPDGIDLVHAAGGVAVLAHPGLSEAFPLVGDLVRAGLDGVEVWHSGHSEKMRGLATAAAEQFGLMKTGGSDCHGTAGGKMPLLGKTGMQRHEYEKFLRKAPDVFGGC